jgi:mannose-1-phosphate guanylyltransferase
MVPINGEPLLGIWLKLLRKFGIHEILINTHAQTEAVDAFLEEQLRDLRITVTHEPELLGSAGTLRANRNWIGGDRSFWVLYADVLTSANLDNMFRFHQMHSGAATLGVSRVPDPSRCGIAIIDRENRVERFIEKPKRPPDNLAFAGLLIGTQVFLDAIPRVGQADIGFDVLPALGRSNVCLFDWRVSIGHRDHGELRTRTKDLERDIGGC